MTDATVKIMVSLIAYRPSDAPKGNKGWMLVDDYGLGYGANYAGLNINKDDIATYIRIDSDLGELGDLLTTSRYTYLIHNGGDAAKIVNGLKQSHGSNYVYRVIRRECPSHIAERIIARNTWRKREKDRFDSGEYQPVPWAKEPWFTSSSYASYHFPHVSKNNPGKLAYTDSEDAGIANRKRVVGPGQYLNNHFGYALNREDILRWTAAFRETYGDAYTLNYAETPDEFENVYVDRASDDVSSCMSHDCSDYASSIHPVRVYAAGDLKLAYLEDKETGNIVARSLIFPAKQLYTRAYGSESASLHQTLRDLGYREGPMAGAKLLRKPQKGTFVCPYIDSADFVIDRGDCLEIGGDNRYSLPRGTKVYGCKNTNGFADGYTEYECDNCGRDMDEDEGNTVQDANWCERCYDRYARYCNITEEYHDSRYSEWVELYNGGDAIRHYAENAGYFEDAYDSKWYPAEMLAITQPDSGEQISDRNEHLFLQCAVDDRWYMFTEMVDHPTDAGKHVHCDNLDQLETQEATSEAEAA